MKEETTGNVRGFGGFMFIGGALLAIIAPPLGIVLMAVGGCMWLVAPVTAPATQQMVDEVSGGGWGCGPLLTVLAVVGILFTTLALVGVAMVGGGL